MVSYFFADLDALVRLTPAVEELMLKRKLEGPFQLQEMPLVLVLAAMEQVGIGFLPEKLQRCERFLKEYSDTLQAKAENYATNKQAFNIASNQQLADVLFGKDELNLPLPPNAAKSKTKRHHTTEEETLQALTHLHPLPGIIIEYRKAQKLLSSFVQLLVGAAIFRDGHFRIYTQVC